MSSTDTVGAVAKARRRPPDRRQQILHHAAELFCGNGFHTVRMEDIAKAADITGRAVYRHFENKQDLLSHVILEDQDRLLDAIEAPPDRTVTPGAPALAALLERLVAASLVSLRLGPLWQREARHLRPAEFERVRNGTRRIGRAVNGGIRAAVPGMGLFESEMRAWGAVSIITSPGHYEPTLNTRRLAEILLAAAWAAVAAPVTDAEEPTAPDRPVLSRLRGSRREQLIATAAKAFREKGFGGVSLDEFGIAGPAVYRYFDGKADLLATLVTRLHEWSSLEIDRALRRPVDDGEVIVELVNGYVRIAVEATDLLAVAVTETLYLPAAARERDRRIRSSEVAEWTQWLRVARPTLPPPTAQALVHAARTMVNDVVQIPHLTSNPRFCTELMSITGSTLLSAELR